MESTVLNEPAPRGRRRGPLLFAGLAAIATIIIACYFALTAPAPDLTAKLPQAAAFEAEVTGFSVKVAGYSGSVVSADKAGTVLSQSPAPGARAWRASAVRVVLAGLKPVPVPELKGLTAAEAEVALIAAGFRVGGTEYSDVASVPAGQVLSSRPSSGTLAQPSIKVDIIVALGPDVTVPTVVGNEVSAARNRIEDAGLEVRVDGSPPYGRIIWQAPAANTSVRPGTVVAIGPARQKPTPSDLDAIQRVVESGSGDLLLLYDYDRAMWSDPSVAGLDVYPYRFRVTGIPPTVRKGDIIKVNFNDPARNRPGPFEVTYVDAWH